MSPLSVPGVLGNKYYTVFKKINTPATADYRETKIYYGELLFSKKPLQPDGHIEIPLAVGTWEFDPVEQRNKLKDGLSVRVNVNGAAPRRVSQLLHSLEITRIEQLENYNTKDKPRGYAFFLGRYIDGQGLVVDSLNLICFRCAHVRYPDQLTESKKVA